MSCPSALLYSLATLASPNGGESICLYGNDASMLEIITLNGLHSFGVYEGTQHVWPRVTSPSQGQVGTDAEGFG